MIMTRARRLILAIVLPAATLLALGVRAYLGPTRARVEQDARQCFGSCRVDRVWRVKGDFPTIYMGAQAWCGSADLPIFHEWKYRLEVGGWTTVEGACP